MKSIVNDPSYDLVSDERTAAQWVLAPTTAGELRAGGMVLAYIARLRDAWTEIERLRAELAKRPKLWALRMRSGHLSGMSGRHRGVLVWSDRGRAETDADACGFGPKDIVEYTGAENE